MPRINGAAGAIAVDDLGMTLMHEHVTLKMLGSDSDTLVPGPSRLETMAASLDWPAELKSRGVRTIVDPAPGTWGATWKAT